jgi:hypothetical protein
MQSRKAARNGLDIGESRDAELLGADAFLAVRKPERWLDHAEPFGLAVRPGEGGPSEVAAAPLATPEEEERNARLLQLGIQPYDSEEAW